MNIWIPIKQGISWPAEQLWSSEEILIQHS